MNLNFKEGIDKVKEFVNLSDSLFALVVKIC